MIGSPVADAGDVLEGWRPVTGHASTIETVDSHAEGDERDERAAPALMIAWSREEPRRAGEVMVFEVEGAAQIFGRGEPTSSAGRALLRRPRPGGGALAPPLATPAISREQLRITLRRGALEIARIGRCKMTFRGEEVERCSLVPGDTLLLKGHLLLLCTARPSPPPPLRDFPAGALRGFGEPDAFGLLGESPATWRLREQIAFQAKAGAHTLVLGPSGAGKELCARAIHFLSARAAGPFLARSAATLPPGLVDAELFGNARNYPNPGMAERPGLVGAADGGTLFLDEIGELPAAIHANLLRVLDEGGEHHRLGEARARRADLRLIAATNRAPEALKHDLLARLALRLRVPGLNERRDDIPLLIRHLLHRARSRSPELLSRFTDAAGEPRVSAALVEHLLHRPYTGHVRELDGLLWQAMSESPGEVVDLPESIRLESTPEPTSDGSPSDQHGSDGAASEDAGRTEILARIAEHGGNLARTAEALGLSSRYALYRLLRKHGISLNTIRDTER